MEVQKDILKIVGHCDALNVMDTVGKKSEQVSFSNLMFETRMNPGVLNRLLKEQVQAGILAKTAGGYILTEKGKKALELANAIKSL